MTISKKEVSLLADIANADNKLLAVEKTMAGSIITEIFGDEALPALQAFTAAADTGGQFAESSFQAIAETLTSDERKRLLSAIWKIAACDGELHKNEELFIYQFIEAMEINRREGVDIERQAVREVFPG